MPTVILNGERLGEAAGADTWGAILDLVDARITASGQIVAAVRFDGVDEPGFREEAIRVRRLGTDAIVEVDTSTPQALLGRVLDEGRASLREIESAARELAAGFRGADVEAPARGLGQLAESLMNVLSLVSAAAAAAAVNLDNLRKDGALVGPTLKGLDAALAPLLEAHRERDWVTVADILEHDVAPAIPKLDGVLTALREAAGA